METEVTQLQWYIIMGKIPCLRKGKTLPVENVSWKDCKEFCEQCETFDLPLKLPTETQWEYACRAGTTSACSGDLNEMAWYENNSYDKSHPVGSKKPNNWGIYDMHGNVWEWCKDWKSAYPKEFVTDPVGPNSGNVRIVRGGSWNDAAQSCRSARRGDNEPIHKSNNLGFRCVLVLPENDLSQSENKTENENTDISGFL